MLFVFLISLFGILEELVTIHPLQRGALSRMGGTRDGPAFGGRTRSRECPTWVSGPAGPIGPPHFQQRLTTTTTHTKTH